MPVSGGGNEPAFTTLRIFSSPFDAALAKSVLDAFGIDSMTLRDDCGGQRPHMTLVEGVRLLVRSEDADRAEQALTEKTTGPDELAE